MLKQRVLLLFVGLATAAMISAQSSPGVPLQTSPAKQEAALANKDVIKLIKLDLGDDVVIAKIKQASAVDFDLTTDGLVQLKQAGVSGRVISAMLERTTAVAAPVESSERHIENYGDDIRIVLNDREMRLPPNHGDLSTTGMWPVVFTFFDYPGLHARTRTTSVRPTIVVRSEHDPRNYYYLGKLDVNDDEDNNRSLKIEQKMSGFSATTRVVPAGRWFVEYDAAEKTAGVWLLTPKRDLEPGEYGVVVPGGTLYEFGID
jgi:hypothetical protein